MMLPQTKISYWMGWRDKETGEIDVVCSMDRDEVVVQRFRLEALGHTVGTINAKYEIVKT